MAIEISQREAAPGIAVIGLSGKLMLGTGTEEIVRRVDELLGQGTRTIIFDLAGVTTLDSTGVGQFIASFNRIVTAGGEMRMAGAKGYVLETFRVSLLDRMFPFYGTVDDAARG